MAEIKVNQWYTSTDIEDVKDAYFEAFFDFFKKYTNFERVTVEARLEAALRRVLTPQEENLTKIHLGSFLPYKEVRCLLSVWYQRDTKEYIFSIEENKKAEELNIAPH